MKSRVVRLCIDVGTWNKMAILRLRRIQIKREIVRILTRIHHGGRRKLQRSRTDRYDSWCTDESTNDISVVD